MIATADRLSELHKSDSLCLAKFRAESSGGGIGFDSPPARMGTLCHKVAETIARESELGTPNPRAIIRQVVRDAIKAGESHPGVIRDVVSIMDRATAPDSGLQFIVPVDVSVAVEWRWKMNERFEPVADLSKPSAYGGTIDRLAYGKRLEVTDYKAVLAYYSGDEIATSDEAQIYVLAALQHFPDAPKATFAYVMFRHLYVARHEFDRDGPWMDAIKLSLTARRAARLRAIESDVWPETPSDECSWCPILFRCGQMAKLRALGAEPEGDPTELAGLYFFAKAVTNALDGRLRSWVAMNKRPVPLADGQGLGMKPVDGFKLKGSYEETLNALEALGLTAEERIEHFRFVTKDNLASRVLKVLGLKMGKKQARLLVESGQFLDPIVTEEHGTWTLPVIETPRELSPDAFDAMVDRMLDGG